MNAEMEEDLISVVVPIYNVEKYMKYCLHSICNQTYKNLEIILVNDASTDDSGRICDEYAKQDERITCIHHKRNKGLSVSRNHGVNRAKGMYVVFVDGDDEIEYNMIEILHEAIIKYKMPVARCGAKRVSKLGNLKEGGMNKNIIKYELLEGWRYLQKYDSVSACFGMYEISLARKVKFPKGIYHEDLYTMPRMFSEIDKLVYVGNAACYHHYRRVGSITQKAYQEGLHSDLSWITLKNLVYFKGVYGEKTFEFLVLEEFFLRRFASEYFATKGYNGKFLADYRKCILQNIGSIVRNKCIGWKLRLAIIGIFFFSKSVRTTLNMEEINKQQKDIMKARI